MAAVATNTRPTAWDWGYEFILQKKKVIQGRERIAHSQVFPGMSTGTSGNFWKPENEGFSSNVNLCL